MIPQNLSPDNCVYYNATYVLKVLLKRDGRSVADLYCEVRVLHDMSFSMFILCLDWLYLSGCITFNEDRIALCS